MARSPLQIRQIFKELLRHREIRFLIPPKLEKKQGKGPQYKFTTFGSVNIRSIYKREHALLQHMKNHSIDYLAITEPMLRPGRPPEGLPRATLAAPGANGRRGLMWIPAPHHSNDIQAWTPIEKEADDDTLWATIKDGESTWFAGNTYWSHDNDDGVETITNRLLNDVETIVTRFPHAYIVLTGDFNADPFTNKGKNMKYMRRLMSSQHLVLVQRPGPKHFTRPEGKSHIDNFLLSKNAWRRICSTIEYASIQGERETPSDHLLIRIRFPASGRKPRSKPQDQRYDTTPLRESHNLNYSTTLTALANQWLDQVTRVRDWMTMEGLHTSEDELHLTLETLKFIIYSASYQSLSTIHTRTKTNTARRLQSQLLQDTNTSEMWQMVKRRLNPTTTDDTPFEELDNKLRKRAEERSNSAHVTTRQWVKAKINDIDSVTATQVPDSEVFLPLVQRNRVLLPKLIAKLRNNVSTGLDNISALQLKRAPPEFVEALAWLAAWCMEACLFPTGMRLGRMKFLLKPSGSYRGLTLESLISKLIENLVVDPIYPCFGKCSDLIAPEQMENRRGASSEIANAIFGIILDWHPNEPLHVVIADIQGAYDNVWRKAT